MRLRVQNIEEINQTRRIEGVEDGEEKILTVDEPLPL